MISFEQAVAEVLERARPLPAEDVPLAEARGRALAEAFAAPEDVPDSDRSLMDGWAAAAGSTPGEFAIAFEIAAGKTPPRALGPGEAARIFTGAPLPEGADAVVMQERAEVAGARVRLPQAVARDHVRRRGDDYRAGEDALHAGAELGAPELALLASFGRARVRAGARPRVALLSSGDELLLPGDPPRPGAHYESNLVALTAQAGDAGAEAVVLGRVPDSKDALAEKLGAAARSCHVLVTTGGASVGDYDFAREAFTRLGGEMVFQKIAIRPGKPTAFGALPQGTLLFALPGNPAAAMLCFELFVRPALRRLGGHAQHVRPRARARLQGELQPIAGMTFLARGVASLDPGGILAFTPARRQGSMQIASMVGANAVAIVPPGAERLKTGAKVEALLLGV
jgi:molybdopterin molybdotransferase